MAGPAMSSNTTLLDAMDDEVEEPCREESVEVPTREKKQSRRLSIWLAVAALSTLLVCVIMLARRASSKRTRCEMFGGVGTLSRKNVWKGVVEGKRYRLHLDEFEVEYCLAHSV